MKPCKVVTVNFSKLNVKEYAYKTDLDLEVGDLVVVPVDNVNSPLGFTVATVSQVEGITPYRAKKATKYIVSKVDLEEYDKLVEQEKIVQEIKNQLHKRKEEAQEMMIYQSLAQTDPEIKALLVRLSEYDESAKLLLEDPAKE